MEERHENKFTLPHNIYILMATVIFMNHSSNIWRANLCDSPFECNNVRGDPSVTKILPNLFSWKVLFESVFSNRLTNLNRRGTFWFTLISLSLFSGGSVAKIHECQGAAVIILEWGTPVYWRSMASMSATESGVRGLGQPMNSLLPVSNKKGTQVARRCFKLLQQGTLLQQPGVTVDLSHWRGYFTKEWVNDKLKKKNRKHRLSFTTDSLRSTDLGILLKCRFLVTNPRDSDLAH